MRRLFIILFIISCSATVTAQEIDTVYFTEKWEPSNKNDHYYRRTIHYNDTGAIIRDYYKNGNLQMEGFRYDNYHITDHNDSLSSGLFTWYDTKARISKTYIFEAHKYPRIIKQYSNSPLTDNEVEINPGMIYMIFYHKNGNIRSEGFADACADCNDFCMIQGRWFHYSKKGKFHQSADITDDLKNGELDWYMDGQLTNKWIYVDDVKHGECWKYYLISGKLKKHGQYTNGRKSGEWIVYDKNGEIKKTKSY